MSERKLPNVAEAQEESDSHYDADDEMSNDEYDFMECSEEQYSGDDEEGISSGHHKKIRGKKNERRLSFASGTKGGSITRPKRQFVGSPSNSEIIFLT
eukprot:gene5418-6094_t